MEINVDELLIIYSALVNVKMVLSQEKSYISYELSV